MDVSAVDVMKLKVTFCFFVDIKWRWRTSRHQCGRSE